MTQEDKDLLLKDLCGRLPYGVKCQFNDAVETITEIWFCEDEGWQIDGEKTSTCIHAVKPYLFPLSSMTDAQKKECNFADDLDSDILDAALCTNHYHRTGVPTVTYNLVDWCIKNHFDFRGLIVKGLAIDATNLNIY